MSISFIAWILKKIFKIILIVLLLLWLLPAIKNTYLYLTYHHSDNYLLRINTSESISKQKWEGIFDHIDCGFESREILTIDFISDTLGTLQKRYFSKRIFEVYPEVYSWSSLLPYSDTDIYTEKFNVHFRKNFFYYTKVWEANEIIEKKSDTYYFVYKISNDSLYFEYWPKEQIVNLPSTELSYKYFRTNELISYWELINPIYLPAEYSNLFREVF